MNFVMTSSQDQFFLGALLSFLCASACFRIINADPLNPVITGGTAAPVGKYPWIAQLSGCGGVMISSHVVLTAKHCVVDRKAGGPFTVKVGGTDLRNDGEFYHTRYDMSNLHLWDHDIAVACLNDDIPGDTWPQLAGGDHSDYAGQNALIAGWGDLEFLDGDGTDLLMDATVPIYPDKWVAKYPQTMDRFNKEIEFAAGGDTGKDTCEGDSGGPLFLKDGFESSPTVLGVTSWGVGCGTEPGIYASVPAARPWILQAMKSCPVPTKTATKPTPDNGNQLGNSSTQGSCKVITKDGSTMLSNHTCSECQWHCLGHDRCTAIEFKGYPVARFDLAFWDCGDGKWPSESQGLCVEFDENFEIKNIMESDCAGCVSRCLADKERCALIAFNFFPAARFDLDSLCRLI